MKTRKAKEASHKRTSIVSFHLHEICRLGKSIETENRLVVARGQREGEMGSDF